jgi:succinate dehydrogenase / fumarate reductase cytochrome b subunit
MRTTLPVPSPIAVSADGGPAGGGSAADARVDRLRRIFSLSGVVPLGIFVLGHVAVNAAALRGEGAFAATEDALRAIPGLALLELLFVDVPLAVHAALGLWLWAMRPAMLASTAYPAGVRPAMRATAIAALAFVVWHAASLRLRAPGGELHGGVLATLLVRDLSSTWKGVPWRGVAYLAGSACVVFHFAAGAWGVYAASTFGRASARHTRVAGWAAAVGGAVLWLLMVDVIVFHATGSRLFGGSVEDPPSAEPCP